MCHLTIIAILCAAHFGVALAAKPADRTLIAWEFNTPGELDGWQPNTHLTGTAVANGLLHTTAINWDPFLTSRVFEIPATSRQCIEMRIKASRAGRGEIYYSNTLETQHGGFTGGKSVKFEVAGTGEWETVRVYPYWQSEKKIIVLRLDMYDATDFDLDYLRITEIPGEAARKDAWTFGEDTEGWKVDGKGCRLSWHDGAIRVRMLGAQGRISTPPLEVDIADRYWVQVRMNVSKVDTPRGRCHGRLWFATEHTKGLAHTDFVVKADGRERIYNVDMTRFGSWKGKLLHLALAPVVQEGATAEIQELRLADDPGGPPVIEVNYLGFGDAVNRAGKPCRIVAAVTNSGGDEAKGVRATLQLPQGVALADLPKTQAFEPIELLCHAQVSWTVVCDSPGTVKLGVSLDGPGSPSKVFRANVEFTRSPNLPKADYVPVPQPVACPYEVGAFYFPGWSTSARWEPIRRVAPIRKPVLGWYDEANPECADWQIKWAVEHGVKFFMVDWYWSKGGRHLEHWIHDAYMKARYRKYLKFCLMWANHNRPGSHSVDDWRKVTQYWIDHYFHMDEYYCIDDRPAVYIWSPTRIRMDVGGSEQAAKLYAMSQQMAKAAGYKGIYFVAMSSHHSDKTAAQVKAEGYEAFTSYHGFSLASQRAKKRVYPFQLVVDTSPELWAQAEARASGLDYYPIVDTGWSSEPWHGQRALIIHSISPKLFGDLCGKSKTHADKQGKKMIAIGPWNEWGEGSYIEPCLEFGFGMLGAMRAAFCGPGDYPPNIAPVDVGLGPYDLPMTPVRTKTAWTFDEGLEGWNRAMGMNRVEAKNGCMVVTATSRDPAFVSPPVRLRAKRFPKLVIRMKVTGINEGDRCQVFWVTPTAGTSEPASVRLDLVRDGEFHDYVFPLSENPRWRGLVKSIRFDPCSTQGALIEVDAIRFEK